MSAGWSLRVRSDAPEHTRALAAALAQHCSPGDLILLTGGLGVGKTVFAQGFARALGVQGPVTSPTFTLVRQYRCHGHAGVRQLVHADLYRLEQPAEVVDLALSELVEDGGVGLVEWGDRGAPVLGHSVLEVALDVVGRGEPDQVEETRVVTVSGRGPRFVTRRDAMAAGLTRRGFFVSELDDL